MSMVLVKPIADVLRSTIRARPVEALLLAALSLLLFLSRLEDQLILLAAAIALILAAAILLLRGEREIGNTLQVTTGRVPAFAALHLLWLFLVASNVSTMPWASYCFSWILGLLPIGYLIGRQANLSADRTRVLWLGFGSMIAMIATVSTFRFLAGDTDRGLGSFLDPNAFGALLYLFLIPVIAFYFDPRQSQAARRVCFLVLGLVLFAFFSTSSRGASGVLLILAGILLVGLRRAGIHIRGPALRLGSLALFCYLAIKAYPGSITRTLMLTSDPSTLFRVMMGKSAWAAWLDHPLMGTGLGTYRLQYFHYRLPEEIATTGDLAHNDFLQLLMEGGPVALALQLGWLAFAIGLGLRLWRTAANTGNSQEMRHTAIQALPLPLAVLGLFIHANVNFIFYVAPLSFIAGLYLACAHNAVSAPTFRQFRLPFRKSFATGAMALGTAIGTAGLLIDWAATMVLASDSLPSRLSFAKSPAQERYKVALVFAALRPWNVTAQQTLAVAAGDVALTNRGLPEGQPWAETAADQGKRWLQVSEENPYAYQVLGKLLWAYPSLDASMAPLPSDPEVLMRLAIDRYPANPDGYRLLAAYLLAQKREDDALKTLWSALRWINIPPINRPSAQSWFDLLASARGIGNTLKEKNPTPEALSMVADLDRAKPLSVWAVEP